MNYPGTCADLTIGYLCHCPPGTIGKNCETDVNECLNNPCLNNGVCEDQLNHYQCVCASGFYGDNCDTQAGIYSWLSFKIYFYFELVFLDSF